MDLLVVIIVLGAALASVAVYAVVGRVLPGRWRKSDVEEPEGFAIESVNVMLGLLFSIVLAFLIATVLADYDKASSDAQEEANAIGAVHSLARGISEPAQSLWKNDSKNYTMLVINQDWPLMQHQEASEPAWTAPGQVTQRHFCAQTRPFSAAFRVEPSAFQIPSTPVQRLTMSLVRVPETLNWSQCGTEGD